MKEITDDSVEIIETQIADDSVIQNQTGEPELQIDEAAADIVEHSPEPEAFNVQIVEKAPQKDKFITFFRILGHWLFYLRKVFLAVPVIYAAIRLALSNSVNLPELVGLMLQADGSFLISVPRAIAVIAPLILTGGCLLMMLLSRKALYAWAISIFSLTLPVLLLVSNVFPA